MNEQPTLVLLHGHGVDASIWDGIYAELVKTHPVVRPDYARQTQHETIEAYAEEVYAQLQSGRVQSVVLLGHSMGGYIALAFAAAHPNLVRGLGLIHSTAYADDDAKREQRQKAIGALQEGGSEKFIDELMPKMVAPAYPNVVALKQRYADLPTNALVAGVRAIAARPDRTDVLRNARFPVLLLMGGQDQIIPPDKVQPLAELSGKVQAVTIEPAGHLSMVEAPDHLLAALRTFLASI